MQIDLNTIGLSDKMKTMLKREKHYLRPPPLKLQINSHTTGVAKLTLLVTTCFYLLFTTLENNVP